MSKKGGIDLDSILDQALDDFEEIESAENAKKVLSRGDRQSAGKSSQKAVEKASHNGQKTVGSGKVRKIERDVRDVHRCCYLSSCSYVLPLLTVKMPAYLVL